MKRFVGIALVLCLCVALWGAVTQPNYGTDAPITCTLASLATSSGGSARSCAMVNNTSNLSIEEQVYVAFKPASAPTAGSTVSVWGYACRNADTTKCSGAGEIVGTDANVTLVTSGQNQPALVGPPCYAPSNTNLVYCGPYSVAQTFGGTIPNGWGVIVQNNLGVAFDATCTGCGVFRNPTTLKNQ